ncbi:MAG TPA: hypothetical protein VFE84_10115 [Patescibacteria group bacterium]|nr:hypothetical protein [Patescibacteria group bacterium]
MSDRKIFLMVSLADVLTCNALAVLGMTQGIWLLNLPATLTLGHLGAMVGGDSMGLAITVPAGAAMYGWAGARFCGRSAGREA